MYDTSKFVNKLNQLNIKLSNDQIHQFLKYYELLIEKNKVMNLTAIIDFDEVIDKHFIDSLSLIKVCNLDNISLIDVGTGAGFPGIPLKIAFPKMQITLLDSLNKRVSFLNDVIHGLQLDKINVFHGRAEDYGRNVNYREQYDVCVSRAVANMSVLAEYCLPFVKVSGQFVSYKSGNIDEELIKSEYAIKTLGGEIIRKESFLLPETDIERTLIVINKVNYTKKTYPRKAGKPEKEPL